MVARIKRNDTVQVVSGKDKGKSGSVIKTVPKKGKVLVKDVAIITRHVKPRRQGETGGIKKEESFIDISNVMPVCTSCNKPTRVGATVVDNANKRMCKRCKEVF